MPMTFETPQLKQRCLEDKDVMEKLTMIRTDAPTYGTPGPTALDAKARHHHLTDKTGIAWVYRGNPVGEDQHILALGRKNNKAKPNNSQYDWDKRGNI
jgi:hypothetical protein